MNQTTTIIIVGAVVLFAVVLRVVRMTREQRMNIVGMWIVPAVFAILTGIIMVVDGTTSPLDVAIAVGALVAGAALGLYQGTHTTVRVDRATRSVYVKVSPIGIGIFVAVLFLRFAIRGFYGTSGATIAHPGALPTTAGTFSLVSVALLAFVIGMVLGLRIYLARAYASTAQS